MSDDINYLDLTTSDIPRPKNLPDGEWVGMVLKWREDSSRGENPKKMIVLSLKPIAPVDVAGKVDDNLDTYFNVEKEYFLTDKAVRILDEDLIRYFGAREKDTLREKLEAALGSEVRMTVQTIVVGKNNREKVESKKLAKLA